MLVEKIGIKLKHLGKLDNLYCYVKIHLYLVLYLTKYFRLIFVLFLQLLRHVKKNIVWKII